MMESSLDEKVESSYRPVSPKFFADTNYDKAVYDRAKPVSDYSKPVEPPVDTLKRLAEKSVDVKDLGAFDEESRRRLREQSLGGYPSHSLLPPAPYTTSLASSDFSDFAVVASQYLSGEGKELLGYLQKEGRSFYNISRVGTEDLGSAVAGLAVYGNEAALLGNKNFGARLSEFAGLYGVSKEQALRYVLAHEVVHASQKGKGFDDKFLAEQDVENVLVKYFSERGERDLAAIASDRAGNVMKNYDGVYNSSRGYSGRSSAGYSGASASSSGCSASYSKN